LNARYRRAVRVRGHFPNEESALNCLYLTTRSLDPTGRGRARWANKVEAGPERVRHHVPRLHTDQMISDQIRSTVYR
jgi:transposase-like protein